MGPPQEWSVMTTTSAIVEALLDIPGYSPERIAIEVGSSADEVLAWASGTASPSTVEAKRLQRLVSHITYDRDTLSALRSHEASWAVEARDAIDRTLRSIREALHRRGRLSSRNEALDEVSRLLFAHVMSQATGGPGISYTTLEARSEDTLASKLSGFVHDMHQEHLPQSLAHEMNISDFSLSMRPQEESLARDIVDSFETLHRFESITAAGAISGVDILNDVFGRFLADSFVDEKELGQYLTPVEVVEYMVRLAIGSLSPSERKLLSSPTRCHEFGAVLDPSCGVGSFLTEFLRTAQTALAPASPGELAEWNQAMCQNVIAGFDKSERMIRLALANMAMFRFPAARLHLVNSLSLSGADYEVTKSFDGSAGLILTNPPFGASFSGADLQGYSIANEWATRAPRSVDSELLFMERYISWLRPGGQLLAVIPDSILTNKALFADLRKGISDSVDIISITSLPPVTFAAAGTTTKTSVLQLRKRRGKGKSSTPTSFFICRDIGFSVVTRNSQRVQVRSGPGELPEALVAHMRARKSELDSSLPVRLVSDLEAEDRWDATYHASLPDELYARLQEPHEDDVTLRQVAVLSSDRVDPRKFDAPEFDYIEISGIDGDSLSASTTRVSREDAPSRARRRVQAGDVLVSTVRPERRSVAVVRDHQDGAVCTTGLAVIRPVSIHPLVLAQLLRSDFVTAQILRNNIGIAYPAIEEACLLDVLLPIRKADLEIANEAADEVLSAERDLRAARESLGDRIAEAARKWSDASGG